MAIALSESMVPKDPMIYHILSSFSLWNGYSWWLNPTISDHFPGTDLLPSQVRGWGPRRRPLAAVLGALPAPRKELEMWSTSLIHTYTHTYIHIYIYIWQWVKTLYPCSSHQNSWDLWMFIPLKMVLIGIDPYPYIYIYTYSYTYLEIDIEIGYTCVYSTQYSI